MKFYGMDIIEIKRRINYIWGRTGFDWQANILMIHAEDDCWPRKISINCYKCKEKQCSIC